MTQEHLIVLLPPLGWVCWWLGGRGYRPFGKGWRRYIFPISVAVIATIMGMSWWRAAAGAVGMAVAHSLGYGERASVLKRVGTILAIGFCVCGFGAHWGWGAMIAAWFGTTYLVSLQEDRFTWAWVESTTGLWQGIALVVTLAKWA